MSQTPSTPLRVLHLDTGASFRGGQNQLRLLLHGLDPKEVTSYLVLRRSSICAKFHWNRTQILPRGGPLAHLLFLLKLCQQEKIQLLHIHTAQAHSLLLGLRLLGNKTPAIVHRRVLFAPRKGWIHRTKYSSWVVQRYIVLSQAIEAQLNTYGIPSIDMRVIPSCVEALPAASLDRTAAKAAWCQALSISPASTLVGFCGHLTAEKGAETLLQAFDLSAPGQHVHLLFAGEGVLRDPLEAQARRLASHARIHFLGYRSDVLSFLAACDLLVFPSLSEGLGSTLLQAGQAETPVIASQVGGIPDIILPGKTGDLVPAQDPQALATAMHALLQDSTRRAAYGHALREHVTQNFSQEAMVQHTLAVYRELAQ